MKEHVMSKYTVSNEGGAISAEGHAARRATLLALVGPSALAIPTIGFMPSALGDPIFAAIERHKVAYEAALTLSFAIDDLINNAESCEVSEAEWDAHDRASENEDTAFDALLTGAPENSADAKAAISRVGSGGWPSLSE
jgi:hypothetical protein